MQQQQLQLQLQLRVKLLHGCSVLVLPTVPAVTVAATVTQAGPGSPINHPAEAEVDPSSVNVNDKVNDNDNDNRDQLKDTSTVTGTNLNPNLNLNRGVYYIPSQCITQQQSVPCSGLSNNIEKTEVVDFTHLSHSSHPHPCDFSLPFSFPPSPILAGTVLLRVPFGEVICPTLIASSKYASELDSLLLCHERSSYSSPNALSKAHDYLTAFLLLDSSDPDSKFRAYYDTLPVMESFSGSPLYWSPDELRCLEGSHILQERLDKLNAMVKAYRRSLALCPSLRAQDITFSTYQWARMCVETRNFRLPTGENVMVPLADMFNHSEDPNAIWEYSETDDQCAFTIRTIRDVTPGEPVTISYGHVNQKPLSQVLLSYGFLPKDSSNTMRLWMGLDNRRQPSDYNAESTLRVKRNLFGEPYVLRAVDVPAAMAATGLLEAARVAADRVRGVLTAGVIVDSNDNANDEAYVSTEEEWAIVVRSISCRFVVSEFASLVTSEKKSEDKNSSQESDCDDRSDVTSSSWVTCDSDRDSDSNLNSDIDDIIPTEVTNESESESESPVLVYGRGISLAVDMCNRDGHSGGFIGDIDALSLARFIAAQGRELLRLPYLDGGTSSSSSSGHINVRPISLDWELRSMRVLCEAVECQLLRYTAFQETAYSSYCNPDTLSSLPSKYRHSLACTLVTSEREICLYWIAVSQLMFGFLSCAASNDTHPSIAINILERYWIPLLHTLQPSEATEVATIIGSDVIRRFVDCLPQSYRKYCRNRSDLPLYSYATDEPGLALTKYATSFRDYLIYAILPLLQQ